MNKTVIDGLDFYSYFKSGADEVRKNKENLNMINVFPVKDGDTGTNLAITMYSIAEEATVSKDFDVVIKSMSNSAFENARGNSGIIFASFIGGFYNACGHLKSLTLEQFSFGATSGVAEAYAAVSTPVEGTMLTVIREWSTYISTNYKTHHYFSDLFEGAYQKAKQVLDETPDMLEILKKNKVVDAGAKGFVMFLEGFNRIITEIIHASEEGDSSVQNVVNTVMVHEDKHFEVPIYRYCTEVLLHDALKDKDRIESLIDDMGDSQIVTGNDRLIKIHLHTNEPDIVTKRLIENGYHINKSKIEDMLLQTEVESTRKSKIAILSDSIADISETQILEEQIHIMPLALIAGESVYLDKLTATKENIETILNHSKTYPTSTQIDYKQVKARLEWLLGIYENVVIISVAKALSGTYSSCEKAISEIEDGAKRITLIDSKQNSGAQGLLVLEAAQMANRGESLNNIIKKIEEEIPKTSIYVSLDTFKYAVKGGRVPNKIGNILMFLGAKPIMSLNKDGFGTAFGLAFSRKSIDRKIFNHVKKIVKTQGIDRYAIVHSNNPELAGRYQRVFEEMIGKSPVIVTEISSIVTIHAGIGAMAIALTRR